MADNILFVFSIILIPARCKINRNWNVKIRYTNGNTTGSNVPSSHDVIVECRLDTSKYELRGFSKCKKNIDGTAKCTCKSGKLKFPSCKPKRCSFNNVIPYQVSHIWSSTGDRLYQPLKDNMVEHGTLVYMNCSDGYDLQNKDDEWLSIANGTCYKGILSLPFTCQPNTDSYYHLPMDAFNDKKLVNPSGLDAKAIGAPTMVPGVKGQALQIDGQIQKVRVSGPGHRMECFGDLSLCPDGYTIGLWLRVDTPGTGTGVYLSNVGDNIDSHGVAMSYKTGRLYWKFRMKNGREWLVTENNVLSRSWYHIMVTWKQTSALTMYINGDKIAQAGTPSIRAPLTGNTAYNDFILGQSNDREDHLI